MHLIENMVVGARNKNAGLTHTHGLYKLKVFLACTDPACYLRVTIAAVQTLLDRLSVLLVIEEEFAGSYKTVWSA